MKRRALTNLLADPNILQKYMDRFPTRKGLHDAQSIANDYFATYFNRSEYLTAIGLNFLTCALSLIFILTRIGFPPLFLSGDVVGFVKAAASGRATVWALVGSYLWNCYDLVRQTANFSLRPEALTKMWLKLWVAAAVAAILSDGITPGLQPTFGFAVGLISIPVLFSAVSDKASKLLNIKTTEGEAGTPLKVLQGATPDVIDALAEIDVQSTVHIAYCDPIHVMMSTNIAWVVIIDLIDQALLFNYIGADVAKIRRCGYRGCIEVATIGANLNGSEEERAVGATSLANLASLLGWSESEALDLVQTLYIDSQVNLIWDLFGGNYAARDKTNVPKTP